MGNQSKEAVRQPYLMTAFVILSEAKNLMDSGTYTSEILRLIPQNDVVGQPLKGVI